MLFEHGGQGCQHVAVKLVEWQIAWRLIIGEAVVSFPVVRASAAGIGPTKTFINVVGGEGGGRPIVAVGAGFGVDEKAVKQTEALRKRMMIGRHDLPRTVRPLRSDGASENCKLRLSIRGAAIAGCFCVTKHLIVRAILLDDVNDVLDGAWS